MQHSLQTITQSLLEMARKAGADHADAVAIQGTSISIEVRQAELEHAERSEGVDIGLRVFKDGKTAIVSGSDVRDHTLRIMADRAIAMALEAPKDAYAGLADPAQLATSWDAAALDLCDPSDEPDPAALERDAREAEQAALDHSGISQVEAGAGYSASNIYLAATNGFSGGYKRTTRSVSCMAIAGQGAGMERDYDGDSRVYGSELRASVDIGRSAAQRALARLDARRPSTGTYPVVFDERISSSLIGHLLSAVNGAAIARGSSWLIDDLGKQVLPAHLSVVEDPHRPRISGSRLFDAEGLATQRRDIVRDGVLQGWTLDLANARKLGMASTANAARGVSSGPSPSNWNIALTPGTASRADLLRDMGTGLLVTSMIGSTINPNTGDYSRGASGFWVENGEIAYPVNELTIAGNLRDMLRCIVPANDARQHLSGVVPSLLVEGMKIAGN
jgi:PmbA protein